VCPGHAVSVICTKEIPMHGVKCLPALAWAIALMGVLSVSAALAENSDNPKIKVLIIDGQNNHDWRKTTPVMKKALEDSDRFVVAVATTPAKMADFNPDLTKYDVILSNYNGAAWPEAVNKSLETNLKEGKIGLVIVHAANNSFGGWNEYNRMIGMGWRGASGGDRLYLDDSGKPVRQAKGEGQGSGHRAGGNWAVTVRDSEHPVTKGMPAEWMHASDELYDNMRGPIENVHLLATAYSKGTKVHEPMIWTVSYGKGRVFHTPMGHDVNSMSCIGFQTTLLRGTEWAATGAVTLPIPANFPTADKTSSLKK
jgi:uncharacterized protein